MNEKLPRRNIDGFVLLNKDLHLSSNAALQQVKRLFNAAKAGHTGSLDPLASGMLPICLGKATKFARFLLEASKEYEVVATLGATTKSGDAAEELINQRPIPILTASILEKVLTQFRGNQLQIPPMYSALKQQGKPLYELARLGIEVDRAPREITIYSLTLLDFTDNTLSLRVKCSKGTYIRTLAQDIGEALGCGAYVSYLHRTNVAAFADVPMYSIEQLTAFKEESAAKLDSVILTIPQVLSFLPALNLSNLELNALKNTGKLFWTAETQESSYFTILDATAQFKGVVEWNQGYLTLANLI